MMAHNAKKIYYLAARYPMRINAFRHRMLQRNPELLKVHLGPGQMNYLEGWINVDANAFTAKIDIWADVSGKLPFRDGTVDAFYSHHVIEHLPDALLPFHFSEMFRALKPGGVIRIGGPNADMAMRKFRDGDLEWFGDFPDKRRSIGGRFANFILCRGEHLAILTSSYLTELAEDAKFEVVGFSRPVTETKFPEIFDGALRGKESESTPDWPHTLLMEAVKPGASA